LGFAEAFDYRSAADVFREHAKLSMFENGGTRDFDIGALALLSDEAFDALDPVLWPAPAMRAGTERFFAQGGFFTTNRKAKMIAPEMPEPSAGTSDAFPFRLNTGRVRDQWHTMTRSGLSPRLANHLPEPFVEVHPDDAAATGVVHGGFAQLRSPYGTCVLKVVVSDGQRRGSLFAPIHWSGETAAMARVGELVMPATDPFSGQPEAKATPVSIASVDYAYRGFVLTRAPVALPKDTWWSRVTVAQGAGYLVASDIPPDAWRDIAGAAFGKAEIAEYSDPPRDLYRMAAFADGRLEGCVFIGPAAATPQWDTVKALFESEQLAETQRRAVLSGKAADGLADPGPVVCACFGVGLNVIRDAIIRGGAASVEAIGAALRAGTNCGSCLPELKKIVARERAPQIA